MTLRDEFEKLCPVPLDARFDDERGKYYWNDIDGHKFRECFHMNYMLQGFFLGRQNTVSVEEHQDAVEAAYSRGFCDRSDLNVGRVVSVEKYREDVTGAYREGYAVGELADLDPEHGPDFMFELSQAKRRTEEV